MTSYKGSSITAYLENLSGVPVEQISFLLAEFIGFIAGLVLRFFISPNTKNANTRHIFVGLLGLLLAYFVYGDQIAHLIVQGLISYILLFIIPKHYIHIAIFISSMGYLTCIHIKTVFFGSGYYSIDVTGTMMIFTQKLTCLAFAYYDGQRNEAKLSEEHKAQAIKKFPSFIEFWCYLFNFQSIIVGPLCFYRDYIEFINGNNFLKHQKVGGKKVIQESNWMVILKKFGLFCIMITLCYKMSPLFDLRKDNWNDEIMAKPLLYRSGFVIIALLTARFRYYLAWTLADIVANASGFGFNGYDENGKAKWDLMTNIHVLELETSTSMKISLDSWNITTHKWLKYICYTRLPYMKTLGVFILSAFWHGFYPGYYFMFLHWAFIIYAGRGIRRKIRPLFQTNSFLKAVYGIITWIGTSVIGAYAAAPYEILEFWRCISFYNSFYWSLTIVSVLLAIILPGGSTKKRSNANENLGKLNKNE